MKNINKIIGQRINEELAVQNKKQKDLASFLGVTDNTVSYFAGGKRCPNIEQILKISEFFNISTDYLLGKINTKNYITENIAISNKIGLDDETIEILSSCKKNAFLMVALTTLIKEKNLWVNFATYMTSKFSQEYIAKSEYNVVPLYPFSKHHKEMAFAYFVEGLPMVREKLVRDLEINPQLAKNVSWNYLLAYADLKACKRMLEPEIYSEMLSDEEEFTISKEYDDFLKTQNPEDLYGGSTLIAEYELAEEKKRKALKTVLKHFEKKVNNDGNGTKEG